MPYTPSFSMQALRYFYEVARYGSFRLAADKVNIAASAISRQIQLLEQELGVKLFDRSRRRLEPTNEDAGAWPLPLPMGLG